MTAARRTSAEGVKTISGEGMAWLKNWAVPRETALNMRASERTISERRTRRDWAPQFRRPASAVPTLKDYRLIR
jgi:hypothetical protein